MTGLSSDTKPTSNLITGTTFHETNTDDLYIWDSDSWNIVAGNTIAQTLSNKTFSDHLTVAEISAPSTPASGFGAIYIKSSDSKIYFKNDGGTEYNLTEGQSEGGEANQNAFSNVAVSGQSTVVADAETDTLTLAAGTNITLTTNASTDTVTIAASSSSSTVTVTDNENTNENNLISFVAGAATATGTHGLEMDGDFHYNPSTGRLTATQLAGTLQTASQTNITSVGALDAGSITSNFGSINVGSSTITTSGVVTAGGFTIGSAVITEAELEILDGASVTTAELNIIDGNTSATSTTLADADRVVVNDAGTMVQVALTDFETYFESALDTLSNVTTVGALDAGSITSGFGSIDVGSSAITTTGTITAGNLTVNGTTTTVNSTTVTVDDPIFTIGGDSAPSSDDNKDRGIEFRWHNGSAAKVGFFGFDDSTGKFTFIPDATNSSEVFSGSAGTIVAALEGNATTATTLETARTIGGTSFDGSANISVALAATATALATARTIGGTSFDGSANIVPATITVADTTDTTSFVALFESATGDLAPKTDAGITYNAGTGMLTATGFTGPLTGNVTGNASGTAATVTGGTQAAITAAANLVTVGTIGTGVWQGTAIAQTYIADQAINEAKLQVSNAPTNGYVLTARSGNTGGMTWEASSAAGASESFAIAMAVAL